MNEATQPAIEPVTDDDLMVAVNLPARALEPHTRRILEQDRRRVAERQAGRHSVGSTLRHTNVARLRELSHAVTQGPDAIRRECSMRVPAEPDRDADLVLSSAADEIERLRAEVAEADADYDDAVTLAQLNLAHFRAAEAEVARLTAANGWRPIETAPKDGKRVLLSWPSTLVTVGQISNLRAGAEWPTHWMPLPAPPKEPTP